MYVEGRIEANWRLEHNKVVLAQACVREPIRAGWVFGMGSLKETGAKTEHLRLRGNRQYGKTDVYFEH